MIKAHPGLLGRTQRNVQGGIPQRDPLETGPRLQEGLQVRRDGEPVSRDEQSARGGQIPDLQPLKDKTPEGIEEHSADADGVEGPSQHPFGPLAHGITESERRRHDQKDRCPGKDGNDQQGKERGGEMPEKRLNALLPAQTAGKDKPSVTQETHLEPGLHRITFRVAPALVKLSDHPDPGTAGSGRRDPVAYIRDAGSTSGTATIPAGRDTVGETSR